MNRAILKRYSRLHSFRPGTFSDFHGGAGDLKIFDSGRKAVFYHSGDFGDIIYALPTIRAMGGGELVIGPEIKVGFECGTRQTFTENVFNIIAPLLQLQPYITKLSYAPAMPKVDYDLNLFRQHLIKEADLIRKGDRRLNLAEAHLKTFRQRLEECNRAWLIVDHEEAIPDKPVLIHRSPRWRNHDFPWDKVLEVHGHQAVFVGLESEYEDFTKAWGHVCALPYYPTSNFLELARVIAGSELYIGNQSAPYAIAEGLKKNTLQETWPEGPNCLFERENAHYGDGKVVYVPKLARTMTIETTACPICETTESTVCRSRADIVECANCRTVYLRTRPSVESMTARYQTYADGQSHMRLPVTIEEVRTSGLRREYFMQEMLAYAERVGGLLGASLDIGCGWGAFMLNARDKGYAPVGVEICSKMADFANTFLGLTVYNAQLEECGFMDGQFSAVSVIHTFEHLPNQKRALSCIHRILRPGGIVCGIVPNYGSLCSKAQRDSWPWLDPEMHYVHFTVDTLRVALERGGFELLKLYTHTGDFDLHLLMEQIKSESNLPMTLTEVTARIEEHWKANEGEEIRFFARKVAKP